MTKVEKMVDYVKSARRVGVGLFFSHGEIPIVLRALEALKALETQHVVDSGASPIPLGALEGDE